MSISSKARSASATPSLLKGSEQESRPQLLVFCMLAIVALGAWLAGQAIWNYDGTPTSVVPGLDAVQSVQVGSLSAMEQPTEIPIVQAPDGFKELSEAPDVDQATVITVPVPFVVTVEVPGPERIVTEYREVYIDVPGPERIVTQTIYVEAVALPTATPLPLAPGTVRVCAEASGVREIYVGNVGVVSGGCQSYQVGVGATYIEVQVNR